MGFMSLCKRGEEHVSDVIELHFNKKMALNAAQRYTTVLSHQADQR
jgi:predicted CopG family antitoxin